MSTGKLSQRGEAAASGGAENQIWDVISNLWHPDDNPDGFVSLGIAENALMHQELVEFVESIFKVPHTALTYGDGATGSKRLKAAVSKFLGEHLQSVIPLKSEHVVITNGVTTAIEHCSWALADPGDAFLLGQPYYRAFLSDIGLRPGVEVVPVAFGKTDPIGPDCVQGYENAIISSQQKGVKVKGLMLCHPNNPLGRCYSRETLIKLMKLCQKHQVHFISDEIYALSVFTNTVDTSPPPTKFESALSIDVKDIIEPDLVHVLWGMSKDFSSNGLRLGAIISQSNPSFLSAVRSVSLYTYPSSLSDLTTASILEDTAFVSKYISTNQSRLSEAHAFAAQTLRAAGIEYAPGVNAAFFLWINLGKAYLRRHPEKSPTTSTSQPPAAAAPAALADANAQENVVAEDDPTVPEQAQPSSSSASTLTAKIYAKLMAHKVFLASGDVTGAEEPGWFRLVFTQPRPYVEEGLERIVRAIS